MPLRREELCNVRIAFEHEGGIALGQRWLAGKILKAPPEDFVDMLWSDVAAVLGGPLRDVPVFSVALLLYGLPSPFCLFVREHLPCDPEAADGLASQYSWRGCIPPRPTWRKEGGNGQRA